MSALLPGPRPAPDGYFQRLRLAEFRRHHPGVQIRKAGFGAGWEAEVALPDDGRGHFSPRPLGDLLDALEEELDDTG